MADEFNELGDDPVADAVTVARPHGEASPPPDEWQRQRSSWQWQETTAILLLVLVCDLTIYRGQGFAGYALLFVVAPALLFCGSACLRIDIKAWVVGIMLAALAARLLWCGSGLLMMAGFALLVAFAMTLSGQVPYVLELVVFASQTIRAGYDGFVDKGRSINSAAALYRAPWLSIVLPLAAFVAFGMIFILANPDIFTFFSERVERVLDAIRDWLLHFSLTEVLFWCAVVWISVGLLRPIMSATVLEETSASERNVATSDTSAKSFLYPAFRNTLVTVIVLFAIYLVFEYKTLWIREFPEGFYYSGYAHEGAAWLTLALALATLILSLVFRGSILRDPRLPRLRMLAWIWSIENIVLALAVYNRMFIYIHFNGMTRMRTVGMFGISAVLVGFILVLWKIARQRNFVWLLRRQLWTLALAVYLYLLTPVDTIAHRYNVRRILTGDPAPSVQISVHPISSEGLLVLQPLLDADNEIIREGVRAMLAQRDDEAEQLARQRQQLGWTSFQLSDAVLLRKLRAARGAWAEYRDQDQRRAALQRFHDYAYQWY